MRVVVIGQAAFGEAVLKRLLDEGEEIVGVSAPATREGARPDPLRALAEARDLPVFTTRELKKAEAFAAYAGVKPDLNVMAFVTDILAEQVLYEPALGTIQYHPSLLPRHRGASAMNWAIIQGDTRTGLTVFWPDKGIDTGPVLLQKEVEITPDDTLGSLYFGKLFDMGVEAMAESVALVKAGDAPRLPQDETQATYEPICGDEHAAIEWSRPASDVYNLVRGCNPQPAAHTTYQGKRLKIFDCALSNEAAEGRPGDVIAVNADAFVVGLNGGTLTVHRVQPEGSAKLKAPEFVEASGMRAGDRLGEQAAA
ncbi:MAG: methionyl-tRNA formyltransferase [Chloroflexi bacterium]|nr:methionyl-tRNA formyltransferase [Chloroflexota bacterium]